MLMATELPLMTAEPKKHFWYDWCEERKSDEECEEDCVVLQNIVETSEENPKATNNFLHDDFFDEFTMCYDKDDDEENDETFHATDCDQEEYAMVAAAALNNTAEPDEASSDNRRTKGAYEYYPLVWYPREDPATHLLALLELDDDVLEIDDDDSTVDTAETETSIDTAETKTSMDDEIYSTLNEYTMANMDKWDTAEMKLTNETWFGDSAASTHMCNDDSNMYDCETIREEIKVGSGERIVATKIGTLKMRVRQTNGKVPGVDFTEHFAPVINDITWRILLVAMMIWKLDVWLMDVETAFLHGEFVDGEQLFMDMPTGYDLVNADVNGRNDCIELMKTAYGTVQSARQFWKFMVNILNAIGFEGGDAAPCLMHWKSKLGIVFIGLYVDDCLCIGKSEALELKESKLQEKGLTLKTERNLKDYLSCDVSFNKDKTKAILRPPHLLKSLEEDFEETVSQLF